MRPIKYITLILLFFRVLSVWSTEELQLLTIKRTDEWGSISYYVYSMDTIRHQLNMCCISYGDTVYKQPFTFNSDNTISYPTEVRGMMKMRIKNGLIVERLFCEDGARWKYVYDNDRHLKEIEVYDDKNQKDDNWSITLSWKVNKIEQIVERYRPSEYGGITDTYYITENEDTCLPKYYAPEQMIFSSITIITERIDEIVFLVWGLFGELPNTKSYTISRRRKEFSASDSECIVHNTYSEDGTILETKYKPFGNLYESRYLYEWNNSNLEKAKQLLLNQ